MDGVMFGCTKSQVTDWAKTRKKADCARTVEAIAKPISPMDSATEETLGPSRRRESEQGKGMDAMDVVQMYQNLTSQKT
jgi:hypothetical protein